MASAVRFQDPGEGIREAEVIELLVSPGDELREGQVVLVVETDKANFDVQSPGSGRVEKLHVAVGDTIEVGQELLSFESGDGADDGRGDDGNDESDQRGSAASGSDGDRQRGRPSGAQDAAEAADAAEEEQDEEAEQEASSAERAPSEAEAGRQEASRDGSRGDGPVPASPATRRVARELGIDLHEVPASGAEGRVLTADVRAFADSSSRRREGGEARRPAAPALPDFSRFGPVERAPLRSVRRTIARRMAQSWASVPHVTHADEADLTALEAFRHRQAQALGESGSLLTVTALVVKAAAAVLKEFPRFNTSLDAEAEELVFKHYRHIGVAVDTERGLLVPTVRDVDGKSVLELGRELSDLAGRARDGKLSRGEMAGASFTVTNVGALGGTYFTPIINPPQVAILGLGRARLEPRVATTEAGEDEVAIRRILPLCLGFDHRVNDGADAARFVRRLAELLADPERLAVSV